MRTNQPPPHVCPLLSLLHLTLFNFFCQITLSSETSTYTYSGFNWSTLTPSPNLIWQECYSPAPTPSPHHQNPQHPLSSPTRPAFCARLSLSLSYNNTTSNLHNISLALLKISSFHTPSHRGTIITLPGGAGESRIKILHTMHLIGFLDLIDPEHEYDFITFDNRGVGYSLPKAKCFERVLESRIWEGRLGDLGGVMSTEEDVDEGLKTRAAGAKAMGQLCGSETPGDADIKRHMSTAYAARDTLEILDRIEEPRINSNIKKDEEPKLKFIGMSYGTMVGLTFASLYPQRVSHMVLDGTVDAEDWVKPWQMSHLNDSEELWNTFFTDCFSAQESCSMYRPIDNEAENIKIRFETWLKILKAEPIYIINKGAARLITYRDVRLAMVWANYSPMFSFPTLAKVVDELMRGYTNVTLIPPFNEDGIISACSGEGDDDFLADINADAGTVLNCGDAEDISNFTLLDFQHYLSALENQSPQSAFFQGERKLRCLGWPRDLRPYWRFSGPFTSMDKELGKKVPILFLGNRLDPMTTISNAYKMAKGFSGSVVVEQDSRGHCALISLWSSSCTSRVVRDYFRDGSLPKSGTVCGGDCNVFDGSCSDLEKHIGLGSLWKGL